MGNIVFWVLFSALVIVALYINFNNSKKRKQSRRNEIIDSYGRFDRNKSVNIDVSRINGLCNYLNLSDNKSCEIDSITSNDLSIKELFACINQTLSSPGEEYLYYKFNSLNQDLESAESVRKLIDYYHENEEIRINAQFCLDELSKLKKVDSFKVIRDLKDKKAGNNVVHYLLDLFLLFSVIGIFISPGIGFVATIIMLIVNSAVYFSGKRLMEEDLYGFAYSIHLIKTAMKLFEIDKSDEFSKFKDLFIISKGNYWISFKSGTTSNPVSVLLVYLNLFLHFDLITYNRKLKMISEKAEEITKLYISVGRVDALIAMASFLASQNINCKPNFSDFSEGFDVKGLVHPFNEKPVPNDIKVTGGVILTGSNASGKSTFLKACGLNVIFAQNFGFSLAKEYSGSIVRLYSSISLNDNILECDSFFVAEAKSLKRICDAAKIYDNVFCLIDEVLKGTNTLERISSGTLVLRYLAEKNCICFAATHDVELSELLKEHYEPYYFTEEIIDGVMTFPYKIHKGIAGQGNAIKLLRLMEFEPEITDNAEKLCREYKEKGRWI